MDNPPGLAGSHHLATQGVQELAEGGVHGRFLRFEIVPTHGGVRKPNNSNAGQMQNDECRMQMQNKEIQLWRPDSLTRLIQTGIWPTNSLNWQEFHQLLPIEFVELIGLGGDAISRGLSSFCILQSEF